MRTYEQTLQIYKELAEMYGKQQDAAMREVFLLLAADTARRAGRASQAEQLRQELLRHEPHHVLKPFPSFVEAVQHPDIANYLDDLRQKYPPEVAEELLESAIPGTLIPGAAGNPGTVPPVGYNAPLTPPPAPRQGDLAATKMDEDERPFKVYRETYEVDETQPPPTMPPQPRPRQGAARPANQPRPAPPARPPARPAPPAPRPPMPRRSAADPIGPPIRRHEPPRPTDEERTTEGAWIGTLLASVVLALGVALAALTLVPFELVKK